MKVLFLANNVTGVNFWRMYQFHNEMKRRGIDSAIYKYSPNKKECEEWEEELEKNEKVKDEIFTLMQYADVIVMGYAHMPITIALIAMFQNRLDEEVGRKIKKPILCEIDDDIISTPDYNPAFRGGWRQGCFNEKCVLEHIRLANTVITSTPYLGNICRKYNPKIETIPNVIDFNLWKMKSQNKSNKLVKVGWIGGGNHDEDFRILEIVVPEVLKSSKNIEFVFVHGIPDYIKKMAKGEKRIKIVKDWVEIAKYPVHLAKQGFDIGIAPLVDNKFNRAKSNLKWLEYSAIGIPSIMSDIEPYKQSITDGKTGYLCNNSKEWINNILTLAKDKAKRDLIGNNAYESIKKDFNLQDTTTKYINILKRFTDEQSGINSGNKTVNKGH